MNKSVWPVCACSGSAIALQPVDRLIWQFYDGDDLVSEAETLEEMREKVQDWYDENTGMDVSGYISETFEVIQTDSDENVMQRAIIPCEFDPAEGMAWKAMMRGWVNV